MGTGVRSGILLAVLGVWLIMRATHQDSTKQTLIDHILNAGAPNPKQAALDAAVPAAGGVQLASPSPAFTQALQQAGGTIAPLTTTTTTTAQSAKLAAAQAQMAASKRAIAGLL